MTTTQPLAILVKGWPRLSETFIAQELVALEEAGHQFSLWSLRHPTDTKTHPLHKRLKAPVHYLPEYIHHEPSRVAAAMWRARSLPGYRAAWAAFQRDWPRDRNRNRARRFGQACVLATELPAGTKGLYAHFMHTPSSVARYASIMMGIPWSFAAHAKDIWTSPEWEKREKLSADSHGAAFGATCTRFGAIHLRGLADDPERVELVYHGLDLNRFPPAPNRAERAETAPFLILSVGRLVEKKGFDRLIDALAMLPKSLNWQWEHIGGGNTEDLMARAEQKGISDRITWLGACDQPEVIDAMRASDLFVLPSRVARNGDRDGLPNVLMEAASQKLPILSTPVSAIPEFITDGVHVRLCDDVPEHLAKAISDMAADPQKTAEMAQAAFDRLTHEFQMAPGIARLSNRLSEMCAT